MSNTISILFWLHKSNKNQKGEAPLMLRLTYDKKRQQTSTGKTIPVNKWDSNKQIVKGKDARANEVNSYMQEIRVRVAEIFNKQQLQHSIHLPSIMQQLFSTTNTATFMELVELFIANVQGRIGVDYTPSTLEKYLITKEKLKRFVHHNTKMNDIMLSDLKMKFICDFELFLRREDGNALNTIVKYCKNLKAIMNYGVLQNIIERNPFTSYKLRYDVKEKVYLTKEELKRIVDKSFSLKRLEVVKDLFIFQCYTALAYADMSKLVGADVKLGVDGEKWIIVNRKKTNIRSAIPLLPQAEAVILKYSPYYKDKLDEPLLPSYTNQKFNSYLKEIADLCGINKPLTSHVGRRSAATTIFLASGVSIETISKILGHSNTKITQQYAVVTDFKISEETMHLRSELIQECPFIPDAATEHS